jgi:hypothetical protein
MFGDYSKDLLRSGITELKAGNRDLARRYLDRAVYMSSDHEVMAEAWYWMSQAAEDPSEKRKALENCLANDFHHARAKRALAILDGRLKPEEIIDPDTLPPAPTMRESATQRFMCAKCGGCMIYAPDGQSLVCEYCLHYQAVRAMQAKAGGNDFAVAMATMRGHGKPLSEQVLRCQGCGAEFILPPRNLSFTCAYCDSPHVVTVEKSRDLVSPDGIIPHAFDQQRAGHILADWMRSVKDDPIEAGTLPRGLYLPIWSFTLGGGIDYVGEMTSGEDDGHREEPKLEQVRDRYPVTLTVPVAASHRPSAPFVQLIPGFDLGAVKPYDPRYLAAWAAELYDVSMAEASLEARSQAYAGLKRDLPGLVAPLRLISTSSANLAIESFRLDLLPVWMIEIPVEGQVRLVLINGQTGAVQGDGFQRSRAGKSGLMRWLGDLLNE